MKKLFFTAIAVVGFGMNSWGHTLENQEVIEITDVVVVNCWQVANETEARWNQLTGNTDPYVSFPIWQAAYETCENNKKKNPEITPN
ncbi:MAG: hypothetical protein KGZ81_13160 [Flavobacteriales bacterium]|nr:hypothetical protein [Flavobacteriales bacterium]